MKTNYLLLLSIFFSGVQFYAQNAVTTFAGSTQGFADGTTTSAKFNSPTGLAISTDGNTVYVADYQGHRIRKINKTTNQVTTLAGTGSAGFQDGAGTSAKFYYPSGIALSSDGQFLFVADNGNSLIRKINTQNSLVSTIGGDGDFSHADNTNGLLAKFNQPTDLVLKGDTVLYISDSENNVIRKMNLISTAVSTIVGSPGFGGFADGIGASAAVKTPAGLALSSDGATLYLADKGNHIIRKILLSTNLVSTIAGTGVSGFMDNSSAILGQFASPQGITIDNTNEQILYVADTYNHRIRKINLLTSSLSTIAGDGSVPPASTFGNNNNGLLAKFFQPTACIISPNGQEIYVADQGNFKVRKVMTDNQNTSSLVEFDIDQVSIFPNPSSDIIELSNLPADFKSVVILDMQGRIIIHQQNYIKINISNLSSGSYLIKLTTSKQEYLLNNLLIKN